MQSDIQIKLEHHLFAMIQRQQVLETRNHDDGNSYTQVLPTRSSLGPVRKSLPGKREKVSSKCKPISN